MGDGGSAHQGALEVGTVPTALRRRWENAEGQLFPAVVADPELYERTVTAVHRVADTLRARCRDMASLVTTWQQDTPAQQALEATELGTAGLRLDLVAAAAFALRWRELAAEHSQRSRLTRLAHARQTGQTWAVLEEAGSLDDVPVGIYQRAELHVPTGTVLLATAEPDETFSRACYRIGGGWLDTTTGELHTCGVSEIPASSYDDRRSWQAACAERRQQLGKRAT